MYEEIKESLNGKANNQFTKATVALVFDLVETMEDASQTTNDVETFKKLESGFHESLDKFNITKKEIRR